MGINIHFVSVYISNLSSNCEPHTGRLVWVGFGLGWAKLDVVFLFRQARWQITSFNFRTIGIFVCSLHQC